MASRACRDKQVTEMNRNHYFLIGLLFLFFGLQFRLIDSMTLTPEFTQVLAKQSGHPMAAVNSSLLASDRPAARKTVRPPDWLGWSLLSIGGVLVLHSFAMPKPG